MAMNVSPARTNKSAPVAHDAFAREQKRRKKWENRRYEYASEISLRLKTVLQMLGQSEESARDRTSRIMDCVSVSPARSYESHISGSVPYARFARERKRGNTAKREHAEEYANGVFPRIETELTTLGQSDDSAFDLAFRIMAGDEEEFKRLVASLS
jgi:hypothetical protein